MKEKPFDRLLDLICQDRLRESTHRGELIESESDKGRIVNAPAFRRLQQKAQVFPLDPNAAVRTRLTHSIEVSQIGRYLAQKVIEKAGGNGGDYSKLSAFVNIVESACLIHDIGNPPFGHLGESAIREWFRNAELDLPDLVGFDGNPQGFRLISFLSGNDNYGLNLTSSLLLSSVKYPWKPENKPESAKKIGLFSSDWPAYCGACEKLNWAPGRPFPFMLLMDTADEIAYSMSDLEDGLEKNIISMGDLRDEFGKEHFPNAHIKEMIPFKIGVINRAVEMAAQRFYDELERILVGDDLSLIDKTTETHHFLKKVKTFARNKIYAHRSAEQVELAGRSVIKGLLNHFGSLIGEKDGQTFQESDFLALLNNHGETIKQRELDFEIRLFRRLPIAYREKYSVGSRGTEALRRSHLIVDFVSGMTDDFALETYQILEGIRIK